MTDVRIPKVGMSTIEVEVLDIGVSVGQSVRAGQVLVNVAADKVDLAVESPRAGVVAQVLVRTGDVVEVGDIVVRLE